MNNLYILTKYEKARAIGNRATQISLGAPPTVDVGNLTDSVKIAEKELMEGKMPLIIKRYFPDNTYIELKISEMIIDDQ